MSPRFQQILFASLIGGIVVMALLLFREHHMAQRRYSSLSEISPLSAPYVDSETVTFETANDDDGSIAAVQREIGLPQGPALRARAILDRLFVEYALPQSPHPLPSSAAIDELFLVDLPLQNPRDPVQPASVSRSDFGSAGELGGKLAIVSLRGAFVQSHPSGIAVEDLTIRSIIGTLHTNLPDVQQVRFLVDGQPRDTLAGHADLTRAYPAVDAVEQPIQPQ